MPCLGHGRLPERTGCIVLGPALHARIVIAQELEVRDAEHLATGLEFLDPERDHDGFVVAGSPGFIPPGASPNSPLVQVTSTVRTPSSA